MSDIDLNQSVLGWIMQNGIKTERGEKVEFKEHYFLLEPFANWHWKQATMKSAQIGWSTLAILKTFYGLAFRNLNCIYCLPTFDDVHDFVPSKVDNMITNNPVLAKLVHTSDAITKKQIGNNFIWYRGTHGKKAAIMHTSDLNIYDEYDASNIEVVDLYASRLQKSKYKGEWFFSNPIRPGGIDAKYEMSDKRHWMIKCSRCNHYQALDYWKNIDKDKMVYMCQHCKMELNEEDRRVGEWIAEYENREMHGYHINQLMAPWVTARELVYLEETKTPQYFYNMILGLPYIEKDETVDKELILQNIKTDKNNKLRNAMGVDVGYRELHYVVGNHAGIFETGTIKGEKIWKQLEQKIIKYNPITVIDANPDPYPRRKLVPKYRNQVFVCFYKHNSQRKELIEWGQDDKRGHVYVDRNQMISSIIYDFIDKKLPFTTDGRTPQVYLEQNLDEYCKHWQNIYKVTEEDRFGMLYSEWKHSGPDHFVHATAYFKMALSKVPKPEENEEKRVKGAAIYVTDDSIPADRIPILGKDHDLDDNEAWKYI
ncbi:hypothetical protein LCGC14_0568290 [marine sediment metagenome]|uniref:Phage terminase large subunit GpA ATPase domain-containing protein n=1 Tax=marine sediment metagenome TaxID=412755 RepID=A0A0F9S3N8_9ZZZZ